MSGHKASGGMVDGAESQHYRQGSAALRKMQGMAVNLPGGDR